MGKNRRVQGSVSCEVCGNNKGQVFEIILGGERHIFDSFECAMRAFSPQCENCGCQIVGHGVVSNNKIYCSYQCANDASPEKYDPSAQITDRANF